MIFSSLPSALTSVTLTAWRCESKGNSPNIRMQIKEWKKGEKRLGGPRHPLPIVLSTCWFKKRDLPHSQMLPSTRRCCFGANIESFEISVLCHAAKSKLPKPPAAIFLPVWDGSVHAHIYIIFHDCSCFPHVQVAARQPSPLFESFWRLQSGHHVQT